MFAAPSEGAIVSSNLHGVQEQLDLGLGGELQALEQMVYLDLEVVRADRGASAGAALPSGAGALGDQGVAHEDGGRGRQGRVVLHLLAVCSQEGHQGRKVTGQVLRLHLVGGAVNEERGVAAHVSDGGCVLDCAVPAGAVRQGRRRVLSRTGENVLCKLHGHRA